VKKWLSCDGSVGVMLPSLLPLKKELLVTLMPGKAAVHADEMDYMAITVDAWRLMLRV
jgi:hypothetical protein